jgi:hypothetical protein
VVNNGIDEINREKLAQLLQVGVNGCDTRAYEGGKLHIQMKVLGDTRLQLSYTTFTQDGSAMENDCFSSEKIPQLYYQGFFGLTAMNAQGKKPANDIELKMVEFYNMDAHFYQGETESLSQRNYFRNDLDSWLLDNQDGEGTIDVRDLEASAHDLFRLMRD